MVDGTNRVFPINPSGIYLQNKIGQNFPQYIDPVSKKNALTPVRTDWKKLPATKPWTQTDRGVFIKQYSESFGNQPDSFWKSVDVHHIKPRIYNGGNEFQNLMPVERNAHQLITTWFANY